jgi:hypothetical protein
MGVWGHKYKFQNNDPVEEEIFLDVTPPPTQVIVHESDSIWGYKYKFQSNVPIPEVCYVPNNDVEPCVIVDPPDSNWGFKYKYQDGKRRVKETIYNPANIVPECPTPIDAPLSYWAYKYKFQNTIPQGCCGPIYNPTGNGITGPSQSVDGEIALFHGTNGKVLERATISGILKATNGVLQRADIGDVDLILPDQTNANGKFLRSDGVHSWWDYAPGSLASASPYVDIIYFSLPFNGEITLTYAPVNKTERVVWNGNTLAPGLNEDYQLSGNRIIFNRSDFVLGDKFVIFYNYL